MAAKPLEIQVISYVEGKSGKTLWENLPENRKREEALLLKLKWLNSLFAGEKEFYIADGNTKKADM